MELFLDANAHVPMNENIQNKYFEYLKKSSYWGHPLASSKPAIEAASYLEEARLKIANLLGTSNSNQIIFTSTCTQACEWAVDILKNISCNKTIYSSELEHSAVKSSTNNLNNINYLKTSSDGIFIDNNINKDFSICIHVHNEFGTIQPIESINTKFLFSDMCQSVGKISINLKNMNIDLAAFGGHKFGGSPAIGILYIKDLKNWKQFGQGSRYLMDRVGTPDVINALITADALEDVLNHMPEKIDLMKEFQSVLEPRLEELGCKIIGKNSNRVPNTTFIKVPKNSFEYISELSLEGIYVGMGSACGSLHTGSSTSVEAIGEEGDFLRISQNGYYGKQEALHFIDKFKNI